VPAAQLLETKVLAGKCPRRFVEVTGAQHLQEHESSPVVTFNRCQVAVFRLDCGHYRDSLKVFEELRTRHTTAFNHNHPAWLFAEEGYPLNQQIAAAWRGVSHFEELELMGPLQEMMDLLVVDFGFEHVKMAVEAHVNRATEPVARFTCLGGANARDTGFVLFHSRSLAWGQL
jgi:hypothetical protein